MLNFEPDRPSRSPLPKVLFGISAVALLALGSTFAANINLNNNQSVEFGQGIALTTACSGEEPIIVTPSSTFVNQTGGGDYYFTSATISSIPAECTGVDFTLAAYGDSDNPLQLTECSDTGTRPVINFTGDDDTEHTDASDEDMFTVITNKSSTGFTVSWVGGPCTSSVLSKNVKRLTLESSEPSGNPSIEWSSVVWTEATAAGPSRYANSLTSGKPSWLEDLEIVVPYFNYSFSAQGMGFIGDSAGYPYVTTFEIPFTEKVTVQFTFFYNTRCADQGIILFPSGTEPSWGWGVNPTGFAAQWNCGRPELASLEDFGSGTRILERGQAYIGLVTYDPTQAAEQFRLTTKSLDGVTLNSVSLTITNEFSSNYRVGFSADLDLLEGVESSYFKNLIITIG